jgi:hypothetical protein
MPKATPTVKKGLLTIEAATTLLISNAASYSTTF